MKNQENIRSIPLGEVKCIWMTAGAVDYKLCSRNYECDSCEYHSEMKKGKDESIGTTTQEPVEISGKADFDTQIRNILKNYQIKDELLYKDNHTWVKIIDANKLQVGIDSFAGNLLPKNKTLVLPMAGNYLVADEPCSWITICDRTYTIKSPVSGFVTEVNNGLIRSSDMLSSSPYESGWLFYVKPSNFHKEEKRLLKAADMNKVTEHDIEKINKKIYSNLAVQKSSVGSTMMDGGANLTHVFDILGPNKFNSILNCIFKFFV